MEWENFSIERYGPFAAAETERFNANIFDIPLH